MPAHTESLSRKNRPRHQSIFFKLFVVMLGTVILTYLAFGGFYRSEWNASDRVEDHPSLIYYWGLLSYKLGSPPDTVLAAALSKNIGVAIGITGPAVNWRSKNFSDYIWAQANDSVSEGSVKMYTHGGRIWATFPRNGYDYSFGTRRRSALEGLSTDSITLLSLVALVWFATWMILRRMLRPLVRLEEGVEAVEEGNLDVQIPEQGRDELSRLARSFNNMTRSLRERLKSRDQLLLDVSHELRSPLTRMRLALEMAEPGKTVDRLRKEIDVLERMASEILETERLQSPGGALKREPADLEKLVREKVAQFSEQGFEISVSTEILPPIPLDPERMRLVLQNIFENAMRYGQNPSRSASVSLYSDGPCAVLELQDYGIGIPEKELPFIFEPFYRVDRSRARIRGYGLGLGLCKRIVELHGGKISVQSSEGEGTLITVKLPLA